MSLEDAEKLALTALKETMEEKISKNNVEVMVINAETKRVIKRTAEQVNATLAQLKWSDWGNCQIFTFFYISTFYQESIHITSTSFSREQILKDDFHEGSFEHLFKIVVLYWLVVYLFENIKRMVKISCSSTFSYSSLKNRKSPQWWPISTITRC